MEERMTHRNVVELHVVDFAGGGYLRMVCECGDSFGWASRDDHPELPAPGLVFCPTCGNRAHTSPTPKMLDAVGIHTRAASGYDVSRNPRGPRQSDKVVGSNTPRVIPEAK